MKMYSSTAIDNYLSKIYESGLYELHCINEGCCGCGIWFCEPLLPDYKWIVIKEVYLNCWSSAHTISRRMKLTKENQEIFNNYLNGIDTLVEGF